MTRHIFRCNACNKYTMKETCACGNKALFSRLLKYSPDDRLGAYRRKAKTGEYSERGLL